MKQSSSTIPYSKPKSKLQFIYGKQSTIFALEFVEYQSLIKILIQTVFQVGFIFILERKPSKQMKPYFIATLAIVGASLYLYSLHHEKTHHQTFHSSENLLTDCSSDYVNGFYTAIAMCQMPNMNNTAYCMTNNLLQRVNMSFDILVKNFSSPANMSIWWKGYSICNITLKNYGKYNRTYIGWPTRWRLYGNQPNTHLQTQKQNNQVNPVNNLKNLNIDPASCSADNKTLLDAIDSCDMDDYYYTADCIRQILAPTFKNIFVTNNETSQSLLRFWLEGGSNAKCQFAKNYGDYNRTYIAWTQGTF